MDIWIALIGLVGIAYPISFGWLFNKHRKQCKERNFEKQALNLCVQLQEWDEVHSSIQAFCATTEIDRFIFSICVNGSYTPRETTAIYQYRVDTRKFQSYVSVVLDQDYIDKIIYLKQHSMLVINTSELEPGRIKDMYINEGVTYAVWYLIGTIKSQDTNQVAYRYCSFATYGSEISKETIHKMNNIVGHLKKIIGK